MGYNQSFFPPLTAGQCLGHNTRQPVDRSRRLSTHSNVRNQFVESQPDRQLRRYIAERDDGGISRRRSLDVYGRWRLFSQSLGLEVVLHCWLIVIDLKSFLFPSSEREICNARGYFRYPHQWTVFACIPTKVSSWSETRAEWFTYGIFALITTNNWLGLNITPLF